MSKNVLIFNPFGIGDVVFSTPIIKALREHFKDCFIAYLVSKKTRYLLDNHPEVDMVLTYDRDDWRAVWKKSKILFLRELSSFLAKLKRLRFDIVLDLSCGREYSFFFALAGIRTRAGFDHKNRGMFLTKKIRINGYQGKHVIEHYAEVLGLLEIPMGDSAPRIFSFAKDDRWAGEFLAGRGITESDFLVGIAPGGGESWGKNAYLKQWGREKYSLLAERIIKKHRAHIILFGGDREVGLCEEVRKGISGKVIRAYGDANIGQFISLLKRCRLLITNDGGPLHLAVALDVPTVSVFGPQDERVYGPYSRRRRHLVVTAKTDCRPCYRNFRIEECRRGGECLDSITVDEVFAAVEKQLESRE